MEKKFHQKPNVYVGKVSINVMSLEKSLAFYQNMMGFRVLEQAERKAVLTADGQTPLLILEQPDDVIPKQKRTTGLYHFALLLPERADLASFLWHLLKTGYQFGASDHFVSEALYLSDPDGNGIEVYRDRPASEWSWAGGEVAMATEQLDGDSLLSESDAPWTGLPSETIMGHIHLHVADLEKTAEFYTTGLGFSIVSRYPGAIFVSTGGYHHHLALNVWNGTGVPAPAKNSVGLNWFTLEFPDEGTRARTMENLRQIGETASREGSDFVTEDPSGNRMRLMISK